jgi:hypothetical protein
MLYTEKVALCSEIHTEHVKVCVHHGDFLNVNMAVRVQSPVGFQRLRNTNPSAIYYTELKIPLDGEGHICTMHITACMSKMNIHHTITDQQFINKYYAVT